MSKTALRTAGLHASLEELRRAGCPVDLSVANQPVEKRKVEIDQVGAVQDSMIRELEDGRVAIMAHVAVTNQSSRPIDVVEIELRAPWGEDRWDWLEAQMFSWRRGRQRHSYQLYKFPGKVGWDFPFDQVINHALVGHCRLPAKHQIDGFLLGISGGRMPAELRHGQWHGFSLAIITSGRAEYRETIQLWTDRLEARTKAVAPRTRRVEQDILPAREVAGRQNVHG
jgi:hypothetical protein